MNIYDNQRKNSHISYIQGYHFHCLQVVPETSLITIFESCFPIIYTRSPLQNVFEKKYCSRATVCTLCCIPPSLASKNGQGRSSSWKSYCRGILRSPYFASDDREQKYTMRSIGFFSPSSVNSAELISVIEGTELVTLARTAVEKYLLESVIIRSEKEMQENAGI